MIVLVLFKLSVSKRKNSKTKDISREKVTSTSKKENRKDTIKNFLNNLVDGIRNFKILVEREKKVN